MRKLFAILCAIFIVALLCNCTEKKVVCPMCGGTGMFSFMEGNIFAQKTPCTACHQTGHVSESEAEELIDGMKKLNAMFGNNGGGSYAGNHDSGHHNEFDNRCRSCYGTGRCNMCAGRGKRGHDTWEGERISDCAVCQGRGICTQCRGKGTI